MKHYKFAHKFIRGPQVSWGGGLFIISLRFRRVKVSLLRFCNSFIFYHLAASLFSGVDGLDL